LGLAYRTTIFEPSDYYPTTDRQLSLELYSKWADQAWREESEACADSIVQPDYAFGFHDGFVDFVYAGGLGEPPPVPPRRFWNAGFRTDEGQRRANQWFEGYRHGARVARDGGYRERATLHSSIANIQGDRHSFEDQREPIGSGVENPFARPPEGAEALPAPVVAPQKDGPVKPPSENKPEDRPAELTLPSDDAALEESKKSPPLEEPATANSPAREPAPMPLPPSAQQQQSKAADTTASDAAPDAVRASGPSSVASSAVSVVGVTKPGESAAPSGPSTPAVPQKPPAVTEPKPLEAAETPLLTPRARAASAQLFKL
jgi:hypothetical protein